MSLRCSFGFCSSLERVTRLGWKCVGENLTAKATWQQISLTTLFRIGKSMSFKTKPPNDTRWPHLFDSKFEIPFFPDIWDRSILWTIGKETTLVLLTHVLWELPTLCSSRSNSKRKEPLGSLVRENKIKNSQTKGNTRRRTPNITIHDRKSIEAQRKNKPRFKPHWW
jgi:hypothetical protein